MAGTMPGHDGEVRRCQKPVRHCERSEAIQIVSVATVWIASSLALLAMTAVETCTNGLAALVASE
jgi:hypothetical protein